MNKHIAEHITVLDNLKNQQIIEELYLLKNNLDKKTLEVYKERNRYKTALDIMPLIYVVLDLDFNIKSSNKLFKQRIGYVEHISKNVLEEDYKILVKALKNVKKLPSEVSLRFINSRGELIYVNFIVTIDLLNYDYVLYGTDITDLMNITNRVAEFLDIKNSIYDNYPGSMVTIDNKGLIIDMNRVASNFTLYSKEEVIDKIHIYKLINNNELFRARNYGKIQDVTIRLKNGDIEQIYVLVTPIINQHNTQIGYLMVWHGLELLSQVARLK